MINCSRPLFDAHLHIIDPEFPLVPNNGYLPGTFTCTEYLEGIQGYKSYGGAIVSGSFQAFDQSYLVNALKILGPTFVGVTQLPSSVSDQELIELNDVGVRALRFNLKRGGSEQIKHLDQMARRVYEIVGWHVELYIDSRELEQLSQVLLSLPAVSIDHLGLSRDGFTTLLNLVENGIHVKATGFGRVDFDVGAALRDIYSANPNVLMFGSDLPCTRAPRPYSDSDYTLVSEVLDENAARRVFYENALEFYKPKKTIAPAR